MPNLMPNQYLDMSSVARGSYVGYIGMQLYMYYHDPMLFIHLMLRAPLSLCSNFTKLSAARRNTEIRHLWKFGIVIVNFHFYSKCCAVNQRPSLLFATTAQQHDTAIILLYPNRSRRKLCILVIG